MHYLPALQRLARGPAGLLAIALSTAAAAEPLTEVELVRRALDGPVASAQRDAEVADGRAQNTGTSLLRDPVIEAVHEEGKGPAGATTNAIGGSITLDLGLAPLAVTRAARLRGQASEHWQSALALDSACAIRRDATELWAASATHDILGVGQERRQSLLSDMGALADIGEGTRFERDQAALGVSAHRVRSAVADGELQSRRAWVSAQLGEQVHEVQLATLAPLPTLDDALSHLPQHPVLVARRLERDAEHKAVSAAQREAMPDLTLSAAGRWDAMPGEGNPTPGFNLGLALQVPGFDGSKAEVRLARARHAEAEAALARVEAEQRAVVEGAWQRASSLHIVPMNTTQPEALWASATARRQAGEATVADLFGIAELVEDALLFQIEHERMLRLARLDLACATGRFDVLEMQGLIDGPPR